MLRRTVGASSESLSLDNPYRDAIRNLDGGDADLPTEIGHDARDELVDEYAWAIPTDAAIAAIADHGPVLEVGAGSGYWAKLLRETGVDVVATDPAAPVEPQWSQVEPLAATEAIETYPDRTLLLVWPSEDATWPAEALGHYDGDTCIYVGEGPGGRTADKHFHHQLMDEWERERMVGIPQYRGVNDRLEVWSREETSVSLLSLPGMETILYGE